MKELKEKTGYPLELIPDDNVWDCSNLRIAPVQTKDKHIFHWNPDFGSKHVDHIYLHGIERIYRAWSAVQKGIYKIPVSTKDAEMQARQELREMNNLQLSYKTKSNLAIFLRKDFINIVTSKPVDVAVERSLYTKYPQHHERQLQYFIKQNDELNDITTLIHSEMVPQIIRDKRISLDYAYYKSLKEFLPNVTLQVRNFTSEGYKLSEELYMSVKKSHKAKGYEEDMKLVDRWAEILGIRHWYDWKKPIDIEEI